MSQDLNRRTFVARALGSAAAVAAAQGLGPTFQAAALHASEKEVTASDPIPVVDTHQHLVDLTKFRVWWVNEREMPAEGLRMQEYLAAVQELNVVKTVYMEIALPPEYHVQEAEYVIDLCRRPDNPMVAGVISGRLASDGFADYITKYKDSPYIKGVREVLHIDRTPRGYCLDPRFVKGVQLLGDLGMRFDLCLRPNELTDGEKLVAQCPRTRFIVDHCGNMSVQETDEKLRRTWMDGMRALAQRDNVVCKISGIIATARKDWKPADLAPNMRFTMETFGPDRRMFAGDWPVCLQTATLKRWVEALKEISRDMGMSAADQRKLFHDNAVKFYGLKDKPA